MTPVRVSNRAGLWAELVTENPLLDESVREQRKFFRTAGGSGKIAPRVTIVLAGLLYLWLVIESCISHDDLTWAYSYLELTIFTIVLPASVYGAISGERERSTWDALILTRLTSGQIIVGKFIWRIRLMCILVAFLLTPILISHPFVTVERDLVPLGAIFECQCAILTWGLLLISFGLWVSAITRRSIDSLAIIFTTLIVLLAVVPALYAMFASILSPGWGAGNGSDPIFSMITAMNPFFALAPIVSTDNLRTAFLPALTQTGLLISVVNIWLAAIFVFFTYRRLNWLGEPGQQARPIS